MTERLIREGRATSSNVKGAMRGIVEPGFVATRRDTGGSFGRTDAPECRAVPEGVKVDRDDVRANATPAEHVMVDDSELQAR